MNLLVDVRKAAAPAAADRRRNHSRPPGIPAGNVVLTAARDEARALEPFQPETHDVLSLCLSTISITKGNGVHGRFKGMPHSRCITAIHITAICITATYFLGRKCDAPQRRTVPY